MAFMDDEPVKKPRGFTTGQDVSLFGLAELRETVDLLRSEIARLEAAIEARQGTRSAADSLFKF
jgi:uncharacterized small protein (DUF1192 family)